jgi:hypothetical protein
MFVLTASYVVMVLSVTVQGTTVDLVTRRLLRLESSPTV